jgi:cyanophycin synthetase
MLENALCAAAACLAVGVPSGVVRDGLGSFRPTAEDNSGRLNVYDVGGTTVVLDFAHNEAGLANLLSLASNLAGDEGRVISVIGTAGDRTDEALRELGRLAAGGSERVIVKETTKYLRGRSSPAEMTALMEEGIRQGGGAPPEVSPGEVEALETALAAAARGDVIAVMCIEHGPELRRRLLERGRPVP